MRLPSAHTSTKRAGVAGIQILASQFGSYYTGLDIGQSGERIIHCDVSTGEFMKISRSWGVTALCAGVAGLVGLAFVLPTSAQQNNGSAPAKQGKTTAKSHY